MPLLLIGPILSSNTGAKSRSWPVGRIGPNSLAAVAADATGNRPVMGRGHRTWGQCFHTGQRTLMENRAEPLPAGTSQVTVTSREPVSGKLIFAR